MRRRTSLESGLTELVNIATTPNMSAAPITNRMVADEVAPSIAETQFLLNDLNGTEECHQHLELSKNKP